MVMNMSRHFSFVNKPQSMRLYPGQYLIEVWGASGGSCGGANMGGGYSKGTLTIHQQTTLYIFVGGEGSSSTTDPKGGFNGGGNGAIGQAKTCCGGGGGGTDIRIKNTELVNRFIVAGGSGGFTSYLGSDYSGGYGGGPIGGTGSSISSGGGGTQIAGGKGGSWSNGQISCQAQAGSIGVGGNSCTKAVSSSGGGGGGYYGGGGGADISGGGGGSGFVSSFLSSGRTYSGNELFKQPSGLIKKGYFGNGHAMITLLSLSISKCSCKCSTITLYHLCVFLISIDS